MSDMEFLPVSARTTDAELANDRLIAQMELEKKARELVIPTNDDQVKQKLIELEEPIIMFGETKAERRSRLRIILASRGISDGMPQARQTTSVEHIRPYYTSGSQELKEAREYILNDSLKRAKQRLIVEKRDKTLQMVNALEDDSKEKSMTEGMGVSRPHNVTSLTRQKYVNTASFVGDDRPMSCVTFSPNDTYIATSSWSNIWKIWNPTTNEERVYKGHRERIPYVKFHPNPTQSSSEVSVVTCGGEGNVHLWSIDNPAPLAKLTGHEDRVNRVDFHPSHRYIGTTSHDMTWRFWDLETTQCLLAQDGHSKGTYGIHFHRDGSLVATAGLDAIGRLWDLRSGKSVHNLRGHAKKLMAIEFDPNGYQIATASDDQSIKIWDLRQKRVLYSISAHQNMITQMRFHPSGHFLMSSSFDGTVKFWAPETWKLLKSIYVGKTAKVAYADFSSATMEGHAQVPKVVLTADLDRNWKRWEGAEEDEYANL